MSKLNIKPNYWLVIFSVAFLLFFIGLYAVLTLQSSSFIQESKENIDIVIELEKNNQENIKQIESLLTAKPSIIAESVEFIDKTQALERMKNYIGKDLLLENLPNPFSDIITFNVVAKAFNEKDLDLIAKEVRMNKGVKDVYYESKLVDNLGNNVNAISNLILILGLLLLTVASVLIHNTIKLAIYANRQSIKTMELTGASWGFITRPFILRSILNASISAIIALIMIAASLYLIYNKFIHGGFTFDLKQGIWIVLIVFGAGIIINVVSTFFTVNKYLKLRLDDLHS